MLHSSTQINYLEHYRKLRPQQLNLRQQCSQSIFCSIFGQSKNFNRSSLCDCHKNESKYCQLMINWIEQYYEWKTDKKFTQAYQFYFKKNFFNQETGPNIINSFNYHDFIKSGLLTVIQQSDLKNIISFEDLQILERILVNYIKHAAYYSKYTRIIQNSYIFIWLALGVYYHVGPFNISDKQIQHLQQSFVFWSIDIIMDKLHDVRFEALRTIHCKNIITLMDQYFKKAFNYLKLKGINIQHLVLQWLEQLMCGYMNLTNLGFYVTSIMKFGWKYIYKVFLSYLERRIEKIQSQECQFNRQMILQILLNSQEQWPIIFCNAVTFTFDEQ